MKPSTTSVFGALTERLDNPARGRQRVLSVLAWTVALLGAVEGLAQWREHHYTRPMGVNRTVAQPDYVFDAQYGLTLLRPNAVVASAAQEIRSNSLGLRSPELPSLPAAAEHRIAMLGASTVLGYYSRTNDDTMPARLQAHLRSRLPGVAVNVINAGITNYRLDDQRRMLEYVSDKLAPELVLVYPGANDFLGYCAARRASAPVSPYRRPRLELPNWLVSFDLLRKNTVALRPFMKTKAWADAVTFDTSGYRHLLEELVLAARARRLPLVLATNARSFRRDQTPAQQEEQARLALTYADCFDLEGLHTLYERHNAVIEDVAAQYGVPVLPVAERVPGSSDYFLDSLHFAPRAEQQVAEMFGEFVAKNYSQQWAARP